MAALQPGLGLDYVLAIAWGRWKARRCTPSCSTIASPGGTGRPTELAALREIQSHHGVFSTAGKLGFMKSLDGIGHMNDLVANGITMAARSILNFMVSDGSVCAEARAQDQSM